MKKDNLFFLNNLREIIDERKKSPRKGSYTSELFRDGIDKITQKVGEESVELVIAAKNQSKKRIIEETADLVYHVWVLLAEKEIEIDDVIGELEKRHKRP